MKKAFLVFFPLALSGCADLTGISGAQSDFPCASDANNAFCGSMQDAFAASAQSGPGSEVLITPADASREASFKTPERVPERIVRLLVSSYVDADGDLHEAHWIHASVSKARWKAQSSETLRKGLIKDITPLDSSKELPDK